MLPSMRKTDGVYRMRNSKVVGLCILLSCLTSQPALSCMAYAGIELQDVTRADAVIIGRLENYRIVLDARAREDRKVMLENLPESTSPEFRHIFETQDAFLSDYARFDIQVDEVLFGSAHGTVTAVWDNSTFDEPKSLASGPYLVALVAPGSSQPPLRGPSATILPHPDGTSMSVLQAPCSGAFIFPLDSPKETELRAILDRDQD